MPSSQHANPDAPAPAPAPRDPAAAPKPFLNGLANPAVVVLLILTVLLLRWAYLAWLCPYELVADEAQYWDWSRRPSLSYSTKPPAIAATIGLSTAMLGHTEFAVRATAPLFGALTMAGAAWLAFWLVRPTTRPPADAAAHQPETNPWRAALIAALIVLLAPGIASLAMLMTIDGPLLACWTLAIVAAAVIFDRESRDRPALIPWLALAAALGAGMLYKYTISLLALGLIIFFISHRRTIRWSRRTTTHAALACIITLSSLTPSILWNAQRGWPAVHHLIDHLHAHASPPTSPLDAPSHAADAPATLLAGVDFVRWLEFLASQIAIVGPALLLMGFAVSQTLRTSARRDPRSMLLILAAAPILLFYLLIGLVTKGQGNWPIAGYISLAALAAPLLAQGMDLHNKRVHAWRQRPKPRPREGYLRRKPESLVQITWHAVVAFGLVATAGMLSLNILEQLPVLDRIVPYHRLSGHRDLALAVHHEAQSLMQSPNMTNEDADAIANANDNRALGDEPSSDAPQTFPMIIADRYTDTALLAFYMPTQPRVFCASKALGGRETAYDFFDDVDLADPTHRGRPAVLVGDRTIDWQAHLQLRNVTIAREQPHLKTADQFLGLVSQP